MTLTPPDFDAHPIYTDGAGIGWVGYGIFWEWPSACFQVFDWKDSWECYPEGSSNLKIVKH